MNPQPEPRIGDAERIAAAEALGEHFAAGRLDKDEYDERSARVWAAKTESDLRPVFGDLPALGMASRPFVPPPGPHRVTRPASPPRGFRFPWLPVLLVVVGLMFLVPGPWWLLLIGAFVFSRTRNACHGHPRRS